MERVDFNNIKQPQTSRQSQLPSSKNEQTTNSLLHENLEREAILERCLKEMFLSYNRQFQHNTIVSKARVTSERLESIPTKHLQNLFNWAAENVKTCPNDYDLVQVWKFNKSSIINYRKSGDDHWYTDKHGIKMRKGTFYTWLSLPVAEMNKEMKELVEKQLKGKLTEKDKKRIEEFKEMKFYPKEVKI